MNNKPIKIVLIEDNPGDALLIKEMLTEAKSAPFLLEWRDRLNAGLQWLTENGADVVLLDLGLPDSQGFDTYAKIYAQFPEVPIVVLSGLHDESVAVGAVRDGAQDYLIKGQIDGKLLFRSMRYAIERKQTSTALQQSHEQLRSLTMHLQSVREAERASLARAIHDELGQLLTGMKVHLLWFTKKYAGQKDIVDKAQLLLHLVESAAKSTKRMCTDLRPSILDHFGIGAAIEWQAEDFQTAMGIECKVTVDPQDLVLDEERSIALFRIFQEALTNVLKHANATKIAVSLKEEEERILLEVSDNGKGISKDDISKPHSFGLLGMRERVYPWRGNVSISKPYGGTRIEVSIPKEKVGKC
jgi:signal transduction histidine kinase